MPLYAVVTMVVVLLMVVILLFLISNVGGIYKDISGSKTGISTDETTFIRMLFVAGEKRSDNRKVRF